MQDRGPPALRRARAVRPSRGVLTLLALAPAAPALAQTAPAKPSVVQEVVVTSARPAAQTLLDRKVFTIAHDLQASTGTAADVLNNVPSVTVDADGNPSLRGDGNVTILVDGKPSAEFAGPTRGLSLLSFPASDIERIEILTNPPAQYRAEGSGGVINIITRRSRKHGGSGTAQVSFGDRERYQMVLTAARNVGRLRVSAAAALRQDVKERQVSDDRVAVDPATGLATASHELLDEHLKRLIPSGKLDIGYDLTKRDTLGLSISHREQSGDRPSDQHDESGPVGGPVASILDRHSTGYEWSVSSSEGLTYERRLWRPGEALNVAVTRSAIRERERYAYRNTFPRGGDATYDDLHLSLDLVKTEVSVDYDLPLSNDRELKLGYDLEDDNNAFDNLGDTEDPVTRKPVPTPGITNHFRYRQRVNAGYAQYQTHSGLWRVQGGVRIEAADISSLQITGNIAGARQDFGAYPSLSLDRDVGAAGKLSMGASRRITRPDPESLNPFTDYQDIHNLRAGNADLLPQDTWNYEVGYRGVLKTINFGVTGYYRFDRNSVTDVIRPVGPDVVLATKANLPKTKSAGLEFNASGKIGSRLTYAFSGNAFYSQIDAQPLGAVGLRSTTGVNLKGSVDYRPTRLDTVQVSFARSDRRLTPQGSIAAVDQVNLGYKHMFSQQLSAVATLSDALDGQRFERTVTTATLQDQYVRHQLCRIFLVGLVYNFGVARKEKAAGFEYDQ